jgi:hypothetical protein
MEKQKGCRESIGRDFICISVFGCTERETMGSSKMESRYSNLLHLVYNGNSLAIHQLPNVT